MLRSISFWAIIVTGLFWSVKNNQVALWDTYGTITVSDVKSYYSYLPAIFIYHDPTFQYVDELPAETQSKIYYHEVEGGIRFAKNMMGTSVMLSPFFFLAHFHSGILGLPQDGYSRIYEIYLAFAAIFYCVLGLLFLRKVLLRYYNEAVTALVILVIAFSTNLYYYTTGETLMSHAFSFSLACFMLYALVKWKDQPSFKMAAAIGISGGMIMLIRPTGLPVFILPLFLFIEKILEYNKQDKSLKPLIQQGILTLTVAFLVLIPQLIFWKLGTGSFIVDSYINERFVFEAPYILEGLFSFRKGWFIYTPIMAFAIGGFWFFQRNDKTLNRAILVYLLVNIYIIFSWWCWWYGGSFGMRAMIDTYAFLSLPMAAIFNYLLKQKRLIRIGFISVIIMFTALNQFQTYQFRHLYILHSAGMTKEAYKTIFLKTEVPENYEELLDMPDYVVPE